jgi:hypothetical protein
MENILEKIKNLEEHHANIGKELDALKKELQKKQLKPNVVTQWPSVNASELYINGKWAASVYRKEEQAAFFNDSNKSGHNASMFIADCYGTWYTQSGDKIRGYLYYKPKTDIQ